MRLVSAENDELLENPQYSPGLVLGRNDFFRNLKQVPRGKRFSSNEESIFIVEQYFA